MRYRCLTHDIEVEVTETARRFSKLSYAGSPQCKLMTMKDIKPGKWNECEIEEVG